jgi:hypothetical protein
MPNRLKQAAAQLCARLRDRASDLAHDGAGLAGVGLISYGCWLHYAPLGLIVAGIFILAGVFSLSFKKSDQNEGGE